MKTSLAASEVFWEEQQRADKAHTDLEHRRLLKSFALVIGLIVGTLAVATVLASLGADWTIRL
jgi:hypothetical protein